jgi:hypothetical protein
LVCMLQTTSLQCYWTTNLLLNQFIFPFGQCMLFYISAHTFHHKRSSSKLADFHANWYEDQVWGHLSNIFMHTSNFPNMMTENFQVETTQVLLMFDHNIFYSNFFKSMLPFLKWKARAQWIRKVFSARGET